jgi:hypothetical protein
LIEMGGHGGIGLKELGLCIGLSWMSFMDSHWKVALLEESLDGEGGNFSWEECGDEGVEGNMDVS